MNNLILNENRNYSNFQTVTVQCTVNTLKTSVLSGSCITMITISSLRSTYIETLNDVHLVPVSCCISHILDDILEIYISTEHLHA